jgi:hypothetical protein
MRFLDQWAREPGRDVTTDVTSIWAMANVDPALRAIEEDSTLTPVVREAIDYLRNWDFRYGLESIGASIFDAWMGKYAGHAAPYPTITIPSDSLSQVHLRVALKASLVSAVDSLALVFGRNLARWRLEAFRPSDRSFPVWSFDPLAPSLPRVDPRRYAPLSIRRPGHPTTIAWESGLFDYPDGSPAHVVARARLGQGAAFSFRPDYHIGSGIIARHIAAAPDPLPQPFPAEAGAVIINFRPTP